MEDLLSKEGYDGGLAVQRGFTFSNSSVIESVEVSNDTWSQVLVNQFIHTNVNPLSPKSCLYSPPPPPPPMSLTLVGSVETTFTLAKFLQ